MLGHKDYKGEGSRKSRQKATGADLNFLLKFSGPHAPPEQGANLPAEMLVIILKIL